MSKLLNCSAISLSIALTGCSINIPYFDPLSPDEVCGGYSSYCQSTSSRKWSKLKPGVDYDGKVGNVLGRKFISIYEDSPCVAIRPTNEDVNITGVHNLSGTLSESSLNEFKSNLNINITDFLDEFIKGIPEALKAEVRLQASILVNDKLNHQIDLEYKRIELKKEFMDGVNFQSCKSALQEKEHVITGISVITVSGEWSKKTVKNILANVESTVGYTSLSAEIKNKYENDKSQVLNGRFEPITYYFTATYR